MRNFSVQKFLLIFATVLVVAMLYKYKQFQITTPQDATDQPNISKINQEQYNSNAKIFKDRRQHLSAMCANEGYSSTKSLIESSVPDQCMVEVRHNILYCPIEKVGSTFWKRTIAAVQSLGKYVSPFEIKLTSKTKLERYQNFRTSMPQYIQDYFLDNAVSLMVVRDPYSKLFSGYVDKIYHTNVIFWKFTGRQINEVLNKTSNRDRVCANHVTFSDFIKFINYMFKMNDTGLNRHFTSMHSHCNPCEMKYDYISKMETFKDDVYHILDDWKKRFNVDINFGDYEVDSAKYIAQTHIRLSFRAQQQISKFCNIRKETFLQRTWQFLQISGLIPKWKPMPYQTPKAIHSVTDADYLESVLQEFTAVKDWTVIKQQRQEAFIQAYQSVDTEDLETLSKVVAKDCELFDYDNKPTYLFDKTTRTTDYKYFDWL